MARLNKRLALILALLAPVAAHAGERGLPILNSAGRFLGVGYSQHGYHSAVDGRPPIVKALHPPAAYPSRHLLQPYYYHPAYVPMQAAPSGTMLSPLNGYSITPQSSNAAQPSPAPPLETEPEDITPPAAIENEQPQEWLKPFIDQEPASPSDATAVEDPPGLNDAQELPVPLEPFGMDDSSSGLLDSFGDEPLDSSGDSLLDSSDDSLFDTEGSPSDDDLLLQHSRPFGGGQSRFREVSSRANYPNNGYSNASSRTPAARSTPTILQSYPQTGLHNQPNPSTQSRGYPTIAPQLPDHQAAQFTPRTPQYNSGNLRIQKTPAATNRYRTATSDQFQPRR